MKKITVTPAAPSDAEVVLRWLRDTPQNLADPSVLFLPHTRVLKAGAENKDILFLPTQPTITLDGLAVNPEATPLEVARAMRELIPRLLNDAQASGFQEVNFYIAEESMADFAAHNGFEEVSGKFRLFRFKIPPQPVSEP